jgi:hypothetical protein
MKNIKKFLAFFAALVLAFMSQVLPASATPVLPPILLAATADADDDGHLDSITVLFSKTVDGSTVATTDFTVDNCSFYAGPYAVTGVGSQASQVTLTIAEDTAIFDTAVTCDVTVNGVLAIDASSLDGVITADDGAAPVIRQIDYTDDDWNGKIDRLIVRYSESLMPGTMFDLSNFTIANAGNFTGAQIAATTDGTNTILTQADGYVSPTMGWVSLPVTEGSAVATFDKGSFALATTASYAAADAAGNVDSGAVTQSQAAKVDLARPLMWKISYNDADTDGKIDGMYIFFSEELNGDTSALTANQVVINGDGGFTGISAGTDTTDLLVAPLRARRGLDRLDRVLIPLTESTVVSTHETAPFSITYNTDDFTILLADDANNQSGAVNQPYASLVVADDAGPVLTGMNPGDTSTNVALNATFDFMFSEPMNLASAAGITFNPSASFSSVLSTDGKTISLTPTSPLQAGTAYTVTLDTAVIDSADANDRAAASFPTATITTAGGNTSSGGGGGGGGGGGYIAPRLPETVSPTVVPAPVVLGSTDTSVAPDKNGVRPGDYIRGVSWSTVYYVGSDMSRHPFMDEQTYFTYRSSWDGIKVVPDAALADYAMGSLVLPKAGVVLVKIVSANDVYALENGVNGSIVLRRIPDEATAIGRFGTRWADYVIDVSPAFYAKFARGADMPSAFPVDMGAMKTRMVLNSL